MRSKVAKVLLVVAYVCAAVGYAGWTASRTVLDTDETRAAAKTLLATPAVSNSIVKNVSAQVDRQLKQRGVDREVRTAVARALRDPRVTDAFADAVAQVHRALLGDGSGAVVVDAHALTSAVRHALAVQNAKLAAEFTRSAEQAPLRVEVGNKDIPHFADARRTVQTLTLAGIAAGLLLGALSLLLWHDRRAFTRAGRRIMYLAITPLCTFAVLPLVLDHVGGDAAQIGAAVIRSYRGRALPSAIAIVCTGAAVFVASFLWPRRSARTPAVEAAAPTSPPGRLPSPLAPSAAPAAPAINEKLYL